MFNLKKWRILIWMVQGKQQTTMRVNGSRTHSFSIKVPVRCDAGGSRWRSKSSNQKFQSREEEEEEGKKTGN
jgi:hypothetical protein